MHEDDIGEVEIVQQGHAPPAAPEANGEAAPTPAQKAAATRRQRAGASSPEQEQQRAVCRLGDRVRELERHVAAHLVELAHLRAQLAEQLEEWLRMEAAHLKGGDQ